jgi:hypothetical protein
MFTSTFIFESKTYDDDFHRFNDEIADRARAIPGFLGEEDWTNHDACLHSEVYYWETREAMLQLIGMPVHRSAKSQHERWIGRCRVVIAEVQSTYGDPSRGLEHVPS